MYLLDKQPGLAMEEFLRVRELDRVLHSESLGPDAAWFIEETEPYLDPGYVRYLLPAIRRSLWAGRDPE